MADFKLPLEGTPAKITLTQAANVREFKNPFTDAGQFEALPGDTWTASLVYQGLPEDKARAVIATYARLRGATFTVEVPDYSSVGDPAQTYAGVGSIARDVRHQNLCLYSEELHQPVWSTVGCSVSKNSYHGVPDNSAAFADELVCDTSTGEHGLRQVIGSVLADSTQYTAACFAHTGTGLGTKVCLRLADSTVWQSAGEVVFDLSTGQVVSATSGLDAYAIEAVGDGWYRCSITGTRTAGPAFNASKLIEVLMVDSANSTSFTGDGTSTLPITMLSINKGNSPSTYIRTLGVTADVTKDVYEFQPVVLNIQNLLTDSETFSGGTATGVVVTDNVDTSPTGHQTAAKVEVTSTATTPVGLAFGTVAEVQTAYSVADTIYTFSVWLRTDAGQPTAYRLRLFADTPDAVSDEAVADVTLTTTYTRYSVTYRFDSDCPATRVVVAIEAVAPTVGDVFYAWGRQLTQHSDAGEYAATQTSPLLGTDQTGSSLTIGGCAPSAPLFSEGAYLSVGGELKIATSDVTTDADGRALISFEPPLRNSPANGSPVSLFKPTITMRRQSGELKWQVKPGNIYDFSVDLIEDLAKDLTS